MIDKKTMIISAACLLLGMLTVAFAKNWIIIRMPQRKSAQQTQKQPINRKKVTLTYWHNSTWHTENVNLIWPNSADEQLHYLINTWLTFLDDEQVMNKKVTVLATLLDTSNQAYISFDRNPLNTQQRTHEKWLWVEGLLKTIELNNINVNTLRFLVHHQPMTDDHLDFTNAWPVTGFYHQ